MLSAFETKRAGDQGIIMLFLIAVIDAGGTSSSQFFLHFLSNSSLCLKVTSITVPKTFPESAAKYSWMLYALMLDALLLGSLMAHHRMIR